MKVTPEIAAPIMGESRHIPWRAPVAGEKPGIVGTPSRKPGDDKKYGYIAQYGGDNGERCHKRSQRSDLCYKYSKKGCTAAIEGHFRLKKQHRGTACAGRGRAGKNGRGKRENERQSDRKGRPAEMPRSTRTPGKPTCSAGISIFTEGLHGAASYLCTKRTTP